MGFALIKATADAMRGENRHSLFLDSGDFFAGTNEANVNQGEGVVKAANRMGYDAMGLGQHDFQWGYERIQEIRSEASFPLLAANIYKDGQPAFDEYEVFTVGGKRIGVFGLTSDQFLQDLQTHGLEGVTYEDPVRIGREVVAKLQDEKADAIVLISHIGDGFDKSVLIPAIQGLDLVLSGRSFALYDKADKVGHTYIAQAGSSGSYVGVADMYFKKGKARHVEWRTERIADRSKEDAEVARIVSEYHEIAMEQGKQVIGSAVVDLDGERSHVRTKETNLANLVTDAMRAIGHADAAILNGGAIRESIPRGAITLYSVNKPLPYMNALVTVEAKGETIRDALENGLLAWPNGVHNGGFPQVSGLSYKIDGSKQAGQRVHSITMEDGTPLSENAVYKLAITDYLYAGGDHYSMFKDAKVITRGDLLKDVVARHIENMGTVSTRIEGRITVMNERYK